MKGGINIKHYSHIFTDDLTPFKKTIKNNRKETYYNIASGLDIETSSVYVDGKKTSFMYVWAFGLGENNIYYGRNWSELYEVMEFLENEFSLFDKTYFVIYIHNLGYEFQFMRKYFEWERVFAIDERKPIRATTTMNIEFRDSYILSGYSLENTAKNLQNQSVTKLVGDLDYSLTRHSETPLTDEELEYVNNDVEIILAYINEQIELSGDINKIPMTNTGRVRKFVKDSCYYTSKSHKKTNMGKYQRYRDIMMGLKLEPESYGQLKRAFMGGYTHANAYYSGQILENVSSVDFSSSYPSVMVTEKYPMSEPIPVEINTIEQLEDKMRNKALIFDIRLTGVESKITQDNYISESKCNELVNPILNNGRVFSADLLTMTITDVDYKIMKQVYSWESIQIANVNMFYKDYLPKDIIKSILKLYQDKTELKDVKGSEVEYMLSKGMLNSVYGMSVTDVVKDNHIYTSGEWELEEVDIGKELEKHNNSKNRFLYYAWGVWVTAYARYNLWSGILAIGDDYIYSDTDSIKFLNYDKHKPYFKLYDKMLLERQKEMCDIMDIDYSLLTPKTIENEVKPLGVWDFEGTYSRFKTLGSKRYLVEEDGELTLTVAGLSKQNGLNYMIDVSGNDNSKVFEMFDNELYVPSDKTGKMTHTYIDEEMSFLITDYKGITSMVKTLSGIHLEPTDFTLSISKQYDEFLTNLADGFIFGGVKYQ